MECSTRRHMPTSLLMNIANDRVCRSEQHHSFKPFIEHLSVATESLQHCDSRVRHCKCQPRCDKICISLFSKPPETRLSWSCSHAQIYRKSKCDAFLSLAMATETPGENEAKDCREGLTDSDLKAILHHQIMCAPSIDPRILWMT